jgi:endonuclease/exonuclease/phosphatase family metal-dependent hydrolase
MTYAFGESREDHGNRYGNGFLTRHPILEESNTLYASANGDSQNGFLRLVLDVKGIEVRVMNTHLGVGAGESDIADLRDLLRLNASPRLLLASSDRFSGDELSVPLGGILDDAWKQAGTGPGFTFPAKDPDRRMDFVFFNSGQPGFRAVAAKTMETKPPMRLPVMVEFELVAN